MTLSSDGQAAAPAPVEPRLPHGPDWTVEKRLAELAKSEEGQTFEASSTSPLPFFHLLERLKVEKREGWRRCQISDAESISDHMYRMSIMTMLAPESLSSRLNLDKCMKMALVHDMAEALVTDITPSDNVPKPEKHRMESSTMDFITEKLLGNVDADAAQQISELWWEYENNATLDAQFVHDIDKMELQLQTVEYERSHHTTLDEFHGIVDSIKLPEIRAWGEEVEKDRIKLRMSRGLPTKIPSEGPRDTEQAAEASALDS